MKKCTKCGESLPLDAFYRDARRLDGRQAECRACFLARRKSRQAAGLPADSEIHGTGSGYDNWGCRCTECTSVKVESVRAWRKSARAAGLPADSETHGTRNGYDTWGCRCTECTSANAARQRAWMRANPETVAMLKRRRRARLAGVESVPYRDVDIIARDREAGGCRLCGLPLPDDRRDIHLDHRIPLVRGGADAPENVFAVHARCNMIKGALSEDEARARILAYV